MNVMLETTLTGVGATLIMDIWAILQKLFFKIPSLNYMLVGRWLGHICKGQFFHNTILQTKSINGETVIGWLAHYATGIIFSFLLIEITGPEWLKEPTFFPALVIGIISVVAPFFILQPGFGFGIAGSKTLNPWITRKRSLIAHISYGIGLYISAQFFGFVTNMNG